MGNLDEKKINRINIAEELFPIPEFDNYFVTRSAKFYKHIEGDIFYEIKPIINTRTATNGGSYTKNIMWLQVRKDGIRHLRAVTRIMGLVFLKNPDPAHLTHVMHIDGNPLNNDLENLKWASISQIRLNAIRLKKERQREAEAHKELFENN